MKESTDLFPKDKIERGKGRGIKNYPDNIIPKDRRSPLIIPNLIHEEIGQAASYGHRKEHQKERIV